ncbi:uncharacterized protein LOC113508210 [Trichoplusia ni]|uniref:Uncharacterized protein LOC113508210 n=1 Tax=Trichoplusia ni TaxID=7111 RepID=A0A7E5X3G0_TRINI|nr:uncharacterized protein LOC113508210 [Trichoplusia ni]
MAQFHFLQGNINHSARAQDLLLQSMAEWSIDVAVVAEPYFVPARVNWLGCADGLVAIIGGTLIDPSRGRGWVAAVSDGIAVVGTYFSPNKSLADFEGFLVELGAVVNRYHPRPVLVLGDHNAKSSAWGSPVTDSRGEVLEEWAVTTGLVVLNRGSEYTCVRQRGGSIVDVSFASPSVAGRVRDWRVAAEVETLSDHRYIRFDVSAQTANGRHPTTPINDGPRWALKNIDRELLEEAALVQSWIWESATDGLVDASARRRVYWWTDEIARLRVECVAARRRYTRYRRRRRRDPVEEGALYEVYRASKETLWLAIGDSKSRAREELLGSLDRDPWGRPYRWVRGKLRPWAPPVVQGMQPQLLEAVVSALFPERTGHVPPAMAQADGNEVNALRTEVREFREELMGRVDALEVRVNEVEEKIEQSVSPRLAELETTVSELKLQLNEREQESLLNDVQVSGVPETKGENPTQLLNFQDVKLGVSLDERDVVFVRNLKQYPLSTELHLAYTKLLM